MLNVKINNKNVREKIGETDLRVVGKYKRKILEIEGKNGKERVEKGQRGFHLEVNVRWFEMMMNSQKKGFMI